MEDAVVTGGLSVVVEPKWKRFERLVHEIQAGLSDGAVVTLDDRIMGAESGASRQIDISIRQQVAQYKILVVMECRDAAAPVDVVDVEAFVTKVRDVRANKSAMVSSQGFTAAALEVAKKYAVDMFRLVDTDSTDWKSYVSIPALLERVFIRTFRIRVEGVGGAGARFDADPLMWRVADRNGSVVGKVRDVLARKWNNHELPEEPGEIVVRLGESILASDGAPVVAAVDAIVEVGREYYFGSLPISTRGLRDEQDGALITKEFSTEEVEPWRIERGLVDGWCRITNPEELAVRPVVTLGYSDVIPVTDEGA